MKFQKRPRVVEAIQWFKDAECPYEVKPCKIKAELENKPCPFCGRAWSEHGTLVRAQDGDFVLCEGMWIAKEEDGRIFVYLPDTFEFEYEPYQ